MKIPEKVKIGALNFKIEYEQNLTIGTGSYGQLHPSKQIIKIDDNLTKEMKEGTFIHEIIETIDGMYELKLEHNKICTLSETFHQIIKDNPEIFENEKKEQKKKVSSVFSTE